MREHQVTELIERVISDYNDDLDDDPGAEPESYDLADSITLALRAAGVLTITPEN